MTYDFIVTLANNYNNNHTFALQKRTDMYDSVIHIHKLAVRLKHDTGK